MPSENNDQHIALIKRFIQEFLPCSNSEQKYSHNEFSFVLKTVAKIVLRFGKITVSEEDLLQCFSELDYNLYAREKPAGIPKKRNAVERSISDMDAFIYVSVSSTAVLDLKKASTSIALQKDQLKIISLLRLKEQLTTFFKNADFSDSPGSAP